MRDTTSVLVSDIHFMIWMKSNCVGPSRVDRGSCEATARWEHQTHQYAHRERYPDTTRKVQGRTEEQDHTIQQDGHAFSQDKAIGADKGRRLPQWVYLEVLFRHSIQMMGSLDELYLQSDMLAKGQNSDRSRCFLGAVE